MGQYTKESKDTVDYGWIGLLQSGQDKGQSVRNNHNS